MTTAQDIPAPKVPGTDEQLLVDLMDAAQKKHGWTDDDLGRHLGLNDESPVTLVRKGVLLPSYSSALHLCPYLEANAIELMQVFIRNQAKSLENAVLEMYDHLKVNGDAERIIDTYNEVLAGEKRVSVLKLPQAMLWVVADATMRPDGEDDTVV